MTDSPKIKVKFHPHWEEYFQEKKLEVLIPAYTGPAFHESPRASSSPAAANRRPKSVKLQLVYSICCLLLINCSAMIFHGSPPERLSQIKRNIGRLLPLPAPPAPASVALALERAAAHEAQLLIPGRPLSDDVLRSSLSSWTCSAEGNAWAERARSTRRSAMETNPLRRLDAKEAGSRARLCKTDWTVDLPDLRSVAQIGYESAQDPSTVKIGSQPGLTLVTQIPVSRLHLLEDQCALWAGLPMAAAIYIPLVQNRPEGFSGLDAAVAEVLRVAKRLEEAGPDVACILTADVFIEHLCSPTTAEPTNALRNRALRLVNTKAVFLSDGRHLISKSLARMTNNKAKFQEVLRAAQSNAGVTLPAFAPTNPWYGKVRRQLAMELASTGFRGIILHQVKSKQMKGPMGWGLPDSGTMDKEFKTWTNQKFSLNATTLGDGAAPLTLMMTKRVPWFDERVRGHAWAQSLQTLQIETRAKSKVWATLGNAWAVRIAPVEDEVGHQGGVAQAQANQELYLKHKAAVLKGEYIPAVGLEELCYY